jgi:DNA-binding NarL/FixJ family response regulator
MKAALKILLVDDAVKVLSGLSALLRDIPGVKTIRTASTIEEAENLFRTEAFDAAVLDINLPDGNGLDLLQWVKRYYPDTFAIMLSNNSETMHRAIAMEFKAELFLDKTTEFEKLIDTVAKLSMHKIAG